MTPNAEFNICRPEAARIVFDRSRSASSLNVTRKTKFSRVKARIVAVDSRSPR
jgi:inosine-uridine nucleoside N-ribohydrolase